MKCLNCGKEVKQIENKRPRLYCDDTCKKRFQRKNKVNADLDQKRGLESIPESPTVNVIGTDRIGTGLNRDISGQTADNLTIEQIIAMPATEAKIILRSWAQGKGNTYQQGLGSLSAQYDIIQSGQHTSTFTGAIRC